MAEINDRKLVSAGVMKQWQAGGTAIQHWELVKWPGQVEKCGDE